MHLRPRDDSRLVIESALEIERVTHTCIRDTLFIAFVRWQKFDYSEHPSCQGNIELCKLAARKSGAFRNFQLFQVSRAPSGFHLHSPRFRLTGVVIKLSSRVRRIKLTA